MCWATWGWASAGCSSPCAGSSGSAGTAAARAPAWAGRSPSWRTRRRRCGSASPPRICLRGWVANTLRRCRGHPHPAGRGLLPRRDLRDTQPRGAPPCPGNAGQRHKPEAGAPEPAWREGWGHCISRAPWLLVPVRQPFPSETVFSGGAGGQRVPSLPSLSLRRVGLSVSPPPAPLRPRRWRRWQPEPAVAGVSLAEINFTAGFGFLSPQVPVTRTAWR